jgi:hypothetical protein
MSIFRDLFVEVPQALLEAAIHEAQARNAPEQTRRSAFLDMQDASALLAKRYGWRNCEMMRYASSRNTELGVRLWCGRQFLIRFSDTFLEDAKPGQFIDALDRMIERSPRSCYCTPSGDA